MNENKTFEQELQEILPNAIKQAKLTTSNGEYVWRGAIGSDNSEKKIIISLNNNKIYRIIIEDRLCQQ